MSAVMQPDAFGGKGYLNWWRSRSACLSGDAVRGRQTRPDYGTWQSVMQAAGKVGMQFTSGARRREANPAGRRDPRHGSGNGPCRGRTCSRVLRSPNVRRSGTGSLVEETAPHEVTEDRPRVRGGIEVVGLRPARTPRPTSGGPTFGGLSLVDLPKDAGQEQ